MGEKKVQKEGDPMVVRVGFLDMQVCVPKHWSDEQALDYAGSQNPCGTQNGWLIRRKGDDALGDDDERQQCLEHGSHVHIMLDA